MNGTHSIIITIIYCLTIRKLSLSLLTCLRHKFILIQICSFIFDSYSINLCLGYQLFIICPLIPLYFSENLHRHSGIFLPNVWTLPSESCLPFCLEQGYSYLCGQGGDVTCTMAFSASMMPGISSTHFREGTPSSKRARSILLMVLWLRSLMEFPSGW